MIVVVKNMKNKAFTMIEVMMALIVVSIMLAIMAPVITVPNKNTETPNVQVMDSTPVGVIVAWWGSNYPLGWLPVSGQSIAEPQFADLRNAIGGLDTLPDLNSGINPNSGTTWIIKAYKK